jgi:hypothetical protein
MAWPFIPYTAYGSGMQDRRLRCEDATGWLPNTAINGIKAAAQAPPRPVAHAAGVRPWRPVPSRRAGQSITRRARSVASHQVPSGDTFQESLISGFVCRLTGSCLAPTNRSSKPS